MIIDVDEKFIKICKKIKDSGKNLQEWEETGYDDEFYDLPYTGGFDHIENAFCFGYYADNDRQYSIQLTLEEIYNVLQGKIKQLNAVNLRELDASRKSNNE